MRKTEPHFLPDRGSMQSVHPTARKSSRAATLAGVDAPAAGVRSQFASERSSRPEIANTKRRDPRRHWFTWIAGASAAALGFAVVLWLTAPITPSLAPGVSILENATVSDARSLMAAVQTAGIRGSPDVKGAIDEIKRLDGERVAIKGWVVDGTASGSSLTVLAFAGGTHVLTAMTSGERPDVAKIFGLSDAGARNVAFQGTFRCSPGESLIVVAVTPDRMYGQFRSLACPQAS